MIDLDREMIETAVQQVLDERAAVDAEDGPAALANPHRWDLVEGPVASTRNMTYDEVCEAVINDLLVAEDLRRTGRAFAFTRKTLVRHLGIQEMARVALALTDPTVMSFLERRSDDELRIDPTHLQDAADFCGFYPEWITPLTGETVLYANLPNSGA